MTQYIAKTLSEVYEITESISRSKAIIDFISGELGNEVLLSQSLGGLFYDRHQQQNRVIALTWEGCSLLYDNVSHDQIELVSKDINAEWNKNRYTTGEQRFNWLARQQHGNRLLALSKIRSRLGPFWLSCGVTIGGYSRKGYFSKKGFNKQYRSYWRTATNRLSRTKPVFDAGLPLVKGNYISLFDRNERHNPKRNTKAWQIRLFHNWAQQLGIKLVVISGLYPRKLPKDIIRIHYPHRNLTAIANIVQHSLLHGATASGAGELACVFGCNFVQLGDSSSIGFDLYDPLIFAPTLRVRGYKHFGLFNTEQGWKRRLGKFDRHNQEIELACFNYLKEYLR
ncbi:MAG: hypothetical protein AAFQ80_02200 [Cyanobacteria bacterium J06621_8]